MRIEYLINSVVLGLVLALIYNFNPETHPFYPRCPLLLLTGWHCPFCGGTRAVYHLLHGNFAQAWQYNKIIFVFLTCFFISFIKKHLLPTIYFNHTTKSKTPT
ncbi:MAG: hypothetical protein RI894_1517 [Bacteroidota bacterium]|jgi:hypothetical protein